MFLTSAEVVELVDTGDLKSPGLNSCTGSSPVFGIIVLRHNYDSRESEGLFFCPGINGRSPAYAGSGFPRVK